MIIRTIVVGFLETNCYLLACEETGRAFVVDPGADADKILAVANERGLNIEKILLTHGHHDHVGSIEGVRRDSDIPVLVHEREADFMKIPASERERFSATATAAFQELRDGDVIELGNVRLEVLYTPGHTPGGVCFLAGKDCITGDTLFCDGVGRTDFEGGDSEQLLDGIAAKLLPLGDDVRIYPGHGPDSTIGRERRYFTIKK